jgi:enterochelin esterase family protein
VAGAQTIDAAGRLAPIAALVDAARTGASDLGPRLEQWFAAPMPGVIATDPGRVAVWHDTALFAFPSSRPPALAIDDGEPAAMSPVPGTAYWITLATLEQGRLHSFSFSVDGEPAPARDVPGFNSLSYELPDATAGTISEQRSVESRIYPGARTPYWLYVNHGVDEVRGAPVMVWPDGQRRVEPHDRVSLRMQVVTDNLVHLGRIPPMVHVLVAPSTGGDEAPTGFDSGSGPAMRVLQYCTVSDRYARHLVEEVLPHAGTLVKLRSDAYSRGSAGSSDGGHCAFQLAFLRPDQFSRALSAVGSFTAKTWDPEQHRDGAFIHAQRVRSEPRRNIRVWLSSGTNDHELARGSWPLSNIELANALKLNGYDFHFRFGDEHHGVSQAALDLPESLAWLWRGYDPDRTEQTFEQESAERDKPPFRVRIVNRDSLA